MEKMYRDFTVCEKCGGSCYLGNKYCEDCANELVEDTEEIIEKLKDESVKYYCAAFNYKENLKKLDKDKISFCIEKLEKVKDDFFDISNGWYLCFRDGTQYMTHNELEGCVKEIIDNQIKELKEKK